MKDIRQSPDENDSEPFQHMKFSVEILRKVDLGKLYFPTRKEIWRESFGGNLNYQRFPRFEWSESQKIFDLETEFI